MRMLYKTLRRGGVVLTAEVYIEVGGVERGTAFLDDRGEVEFAPMK